MARAAGVSPATASRVLNGGERVVGPDLRERVLETARGMHYVPNAHAQALAGGATATVGLVLHDITDPYFAAIARGAIEVASEAEALVMVGSTFRSTQREIDFVRAFRAQQVDALVLTGSGFDDPAFAAAWWIALAAVTDVEPDGASGRDGAETDPESSSEFL